MLRRLRLGMITMCKGSESGKGDVKESMVGDDGNV
jgi:hypothetical protein